MFLSLIPSLHLASGLYQQAVLTGSTGPNPSHQPERVCGEGSKGLPESYQPWPYVLRLKPRHLPSSH